MTSREPRIALQYVHTLYEAGTLGNQGDGLLLSRFAQNRDRSAEVAFSILVERHGLRVLRVCRSILRDLDDAQDAFQVTFLILAQKAGTLRIREGETLGPWLHRVAARVSSRARASAIRRQTHESQALDGRAFSDPPDGLPDESEAIILGEIRALPERYRLAVWSCCVEGDSIAEAAQRLGCPPGTLQSRLARGRGILRERLGRRGILPSMIVVAGSSRSAVSSVLMGSTIRSACLLITGGPSLSGGAGRLWKAVMEEMFMAKLKLSAAAMIAIAGIAFVGLSHGEPSRESRPDIAIGQPEREGPKDSFQAIVVDRETGKPIPGATIRAESTRPAALVKADPEGAASVPSPRYPRYDFVIDAWAEGYQARRFEFADDLPNRQIGRLPDNGAVRLALSRGESTIGGMVVDRKGRPIPGATVELSGNRSGGGHAAFSRLPYLTDEAGRWSSSSMPKDLAELFIHARHPDHVLERVVAAKPRDLQDYMAGHGSIAMDSGVRIRGRVVGQDGRGLGAARVIKLERAIGFEDRDESWTDAKGGFAFRSATRPGTAAALLASAPGHSPKLVTVRPETDPEELDIRLEAGRSVVFRVVDPGWDPIEGAEISASTWKDRDWWEPIGITGPDGQLRWDGAPEGAVMVGFGARGFKGRTEKVTPSQHPFELVLRPVLNVDFRVADATTGKPIPRFQIVRGRANPEGGGVAWEAGPRGSDPPNIDGVGHVQLDAQSAAYRLRVLAQGYRPSETEEIAQRSGRMRIDFKLTPLQFGEGGGPSGVVVDRDGNPATAIEVILATAGRPASLLEGGTWQQARGFLHPNEAAMIATDPKGRFTFLPIEGPFIAAAAHPDLGYGEADRDELAKAGRITLKPWGRLEGRVNVDGPVRISMNIGSPFGGTDRPERISWFRQAQADENGRFAFDQLPPGLVRVVAQRNGRFLAEAVAKIVPGETTKMELREVEEPKGRAIHGRAVLPEKMNRPFDFSKTAGPSLLVEKPALPIPYGTLREPYIQYTWLEDQAGKSRRLFQNRSFVIDSNGRFRIRGVLPGTYLLYSVFVQPGQGDQLIRVGSLEARVLIPNGPPDQPIDLGDLTITVTPPKRVVQVGEEAPPLKARSLDGGLLSLDDYRGKFVLLNFWATWSGPFIDQLPHLRALNERFARAGRFTVIGLNLDDDPNSVREFLESRPQPWPQGFLGRWSDDPVTKAYGVEAIPSIWLIGPDGRVIAKDLRGEAIEAAIAGALP